MLRKSSYQTIFSIGLFFFVFSLLLESCQFPGLLSTSSFDSEEVIAQKETISQRMTETVEGKKIETSTSIPPTMTPTLETQCAYVWTLKQDDELSQLFHSALDITLQKVAAVGVVWYGENCINTQTNALVRFYEANLDITILFETDEEITQQWLGEHIYSVMNRFEPVFQERTDLERYPVNLHFVYTKDGKNVYLNFDLNQYRDINGDSQYQGADLYFALFQ